MEPIAWDYLNKGDCENASAMFLSLANASPTRKCEDYQKLHRVTKVLVNPGAVPDPERYQDIIDALNADLPLTAYFGPCTKRNEVLKAFNRLTRYVHPDKNPLPEAESAFKRLMELKEDALQKVENAESQPDLLSPTAARDGDLGGLSPASPLSPASSMSPSFSPVASQAKANRRAFAKWERQEKEKMAQQSRDFDGLMASMKGMKGQGKLNIKLGKPPPQPSTVTPEATSLPSIASPSRKRMMQASLDKQLGNSLDSKIAKISAELMANSLEESGFASASMSPSVKSVKTKRTPMPRLRK